MNDAQKVTLLYYALKRIASYDSPQKLRRNSLRAYGLEDANEAIEYAYENVLFEAKAAIRGMRRPKAKEGA